MKCTLEKQTQRTKSETEIKQEGKQVPFVIIELFGYVFFP